MILTCPSCATRYLVDPAQLGAGGRTVRCAKCGHEWAATPEPEVLAAAPPPFVAPPEPAPAEAPAAAAPEPTPAPRDEEPTFRRREPAANLPAVRQPPPRRAGLGWLLLLLFVLAVLAGLYAGREAVIAALPQARPLYTQLGLAAPEPPAPALLVRNLQSRFQGEGERLAVSITFEVYNPAALPRPLPPVRVMLRAADQRELKDWTVRAEAPTIGPGEAVRLSTEEPAPPDAREVLVRLVSQP